MTVPYRIADNVTCELVTKTQTHSPRGRDTRTKPAVYLPVRDNLSVKRFYEAVSKLIKTQEEKMIYECARETRWLMQKWIYHEILTIFMVSSDRWPLIHGWS